MKMRTFLTLICAAALFAGCAAHDAPLVPAAPAADTAAGRPSPAPDDDAVVLTATAIPAAHHHKAQLRIHIRIPRRKHHHHAGAHFISAGTMGMTMVFTGPTILNESVGLTPTSQGCSGSPTATTCTFTVALLPGSYTGTISTYDNAPVSGAIPGNAALLSIASAVPFSMSGGFINSIDFSLGGVVASFGAPAYLATDGAATTPTVTLVAQDADGNPITGTTAFANPVTVSINETGGTGHATLSLNGGGGQAHVRATKPSDTVTLNYDGKSPSAYALSIGLSAPAYSGHGGGSATIDVTTIAVSNAEYAAGVLALKGNGDVQTLAISETHAPSQPTFSATASGCSAIADANTPVSSSGSGTVVVFARSVASSAGCTINVSDGSTILPVAVTNTYSGVEGTPAVSYVATLTGGIAQKIAVGPDGAMWFAESTAPSHVGRITATGVSPTLNEYALPTPDPVHLPSISAIAPGPDGKMWFAGYPYSQGIGNIAVGGCATSCAQFPSPYNQNPFDIVQGPDGAMWFTRYDQTNTNDISRATTDGTVTANYSTGITTGAGVGNIAVGPDGNLWFNEFNCTGKIGKMTTSGVGAEYAVDNTYDVVAGPDGSMWIAGFSGVWKATTPASGAPTFTFINNSDLLPPTAGQTFGAESPFRLTTGPDGAIWYIMAQPASDGNYYIARIDPSTNAVTAVSVGMGGRPLGIAAGPDGAIWFTGVNGSSANAIGRIALSTSSAARRAPGKRRIIK